MILRFLILVYIFFFSTMLLASNYDVSILKCENEYTGAREDVCIKGVNYASYEYSTVGSLKISSDPNSVISTEEALTTSIDRCRLYNSQRSGDWFECEAGANYFFEALRNYCK